MPQGTTPTSLTAPTTTRQVHLAARPVGEPTPTDFRLEEVELAPPEAGQVLIRNTWMSIDPYMRGRMDERPSHVLPAFELDGPLDGSAVGIVTVSNDPAVPVGATVSHFAGWREHAVLDVNDVTVIDTAQLPPETFLGALGTTGLTAYAALTDIAPVEEGDVVFISGAAGAVGSVAGQFAKRLGASKVIGSAGGAVKAKAVVDRFGFDAAIDYRSAPVGPQLQQAAPDGLDVYLDAVGGDHLEAAIDALKVGGRVALVGSISGYNATSPVPGPTNLHLAVEKQLTLRGLQVATYLPRFGEFIDRVAPWLVDGSLHAEQTIVEGLDNAPEALIGQLRGANTGKMLVRLAG